MMVEMKIKAPDKSELWDGKTFDPSKKTLTFPVSGGPWIAEDEFTTAREELAEALEELGVPVEAVTVIADPTIIAYDFCEKICNVVLDGEADVCDLYYLPSPVLEPGMCEPVLSMSVDAADKLFGRFGFRVDRAPEYSARELAGFVEKATASFLSHNGYYAGSYEDDAIDIFVSEVYMTRYHGDTVEQCYAEITSPDLVPFSQMKDVQELCDEFSS